MEDLLQQNVARVNRRALFGSMAGGGGTAALASLLGREATAGPPGTPGFPGAAPRARRVVMLWQGGGPSHVDLFDDKPVMRQMAGQRQNLVMMRRTHSFDFCANPRPEGV